MNRIDCEEEEELCNEFGVYDTPKLFIYKSNNNTDPIEINYKDYLNKNNNIISIIKNTIFNIMEDFVEIVNSNNYVDYIKKSKKMKVLLFSSRKTTPPIFKVLSKEFKTYIDFGIVKVNYETELVNNFSIKNNPSIITINDANNYIGNIYNDEPNKDNISKYLRNQLHDFNTNSISLKLIYSKNDILKYSDLCSIKEKDYCLFIVSDSNIISKQINDNFIEDVVKIINLKIKDIDSKKLFEHFNHEYKNQDYVFILRSKRSKGMIFDKKYNYDNIKSFLEFYLSGGLNYKLFKNNIRNYLTKYNSEL